MTGPRVRVGHSFKFLVPLKRKLKVRWTRKKIVSFHRRRQITLADHSVFFPLKFYLSDMSRGRWQLNGLKNKIVWSWCSWQDISSYEYWRNLGDPQIFDKFLKLEVAFILRYLVFFYFFFAETDKTSSEWPKPKYIICKTPHYVSSSICLYPEISFECWDYLFARIELFLNENRYLRCHAERPVSGWVWSYFIWREWFSLSYAHGNKASWTHSWRATFNQSALRAFVLVIIW